MFPYRSASFHDGKKEMASRFPGDTKLILWLAAIFVPIIVLGEMGYWVLVWLGYFG